MGARNQVGRGTSYRPARIHMLAGYIDSLESIVGLLKSLKIRALTCGTTSTDPPFHPPPLSPTTPCQTPPPQPITRAEHRPRACSINLLEYGYNSIEKSAELSDTGISGTSHRHTTYITVTFLTPPPPLEGVY